MGNDAKIRNYRRKDECMNIKGYANLSGTKDYFKRLGFSDSVLRTTPWFKSFPIALGTHLGDFSDNDSQMYRKSISFALQNGINFIDTAINYRGMRSERDIGYVLHKLINEEKLIKRSEVVISTKAGSIPGDIEANLRPDKYLEEKLLNPGIIKESDINIIIKQLESGIIQHIRHTLEPSYFKFAIENSKKNLKLETLDIHYLHNPGTSKKAIGEDKFYNKLESLFEFYEDQVKKNNIRFYGIASWHEFLLSENEEGFISIERAVEIAKSVAGENHHFKFIQLPYNSAFIDALENKNQRVNGELLSAIQAVNKLGLNVTTSASLAQGEKFDDKKPEEFLRHIIDTNGIYAAMVGMKNISHTKENIENVIRTLA